MILADIGCTPSRRQQLFVSTSKDGLTFSAPQMLTGTGVEGLDPTGYEVSPNLFRIYYSQAGANKADQNYQIKRGTLTLTPATTTPGSGVSNPTKTSITCVKGKSSKKVSGVNPKCPKGFKKK
jgi:hypothetical protein